MAFANRGVRTQWGLIDVPAEPVSPWTGIGELAQVHVYVYGPTKMPCFPEFVNHVTR